MIHIWYNPMDEFHYAQLSGNRLKLNGAEGVTAYIDGLCENLTGIERVADNRIHIPYTPEVWRKLQEYGVEVVR